MNTRVMNFTKTTLLTLGVFCVLTLPMNTLAQETPTTVEPSIIQQTLHSIVVTVFGWFVGATGTAFDWVVKEFILEFGENYKTTNIGAVIDNLWSTVRDIFNLTFIFGLVWIGFQMILGNNSNAQRSLGYLIAAALLVNFSLFITKFVVDFANIAAIQINNAFTGTGTISEGFINNIALTQALNFTDFESGAGSYAYIFGLMVLFLVTAFVFAAGAVLITIRYIALNIYLVLSPIMFLGWVFPGMARYSKEYWSGFLGRAFFAPAYMFMLYLSFQIVSQYREGRPGGDIAAMFNQSRDAATTGEIMGYFILATGFMLASLVVAQKMGANGATAAIAVGQRMRRSTQGFIGRNTVGAASARLEKLNDRMEGSRTGRNLKRLTSIATLGAVTERERRNLINAGKNAKFGGSYSAADDKKFTEERNTTRSKVAREVKTSATITAGTDAQRKLASGLALSPADRTALQARVDAMRLIAPSLSGKQLEEMSDSQREAISAHLTSSQIENLMKSDKVSDDDKEKIATARQDAIKKIIGSTTGVVSEEFTKLSVDQIETMGAQWIAENAHQFSHSQFEDIKKSKKFTESQKNTFAGARGAKHDSAAAAATAAGLPGAAPGAGAAAANQFRQLFKITKNGVESDRKPGEIAMLPDKVLMSEYALPYLSDKVLKEIASKGSLTPTQQRLLEANINAATGTRHPEATSYFNTVHFRNNWG